MRQVPEILQCESRQECDEWYNLFRAFDIDNDGLVPAVELKRAIRTGAFAFGLSGEQAQALISGVDANKDSVIDFPEFSALMARAKKMRMRGILVYAARSVLPRDQQTEKIRYLLQYNCLPPPLFMVIISILQIAFYFYNEIRFCGANRFLPAKCAPVESELILNPCRKRDLWRFFTYMFVHVGFVHLLTNLAVQTLLGIPLELVHKYWRVGSLYLLGVMSGALLFFVFDRNVYLAGASGGVYTLLSAHIANVVINWGEMEMNWMHASVLGVFVSADIGVSIYQRYFAETPNKVSYISHVGGFMAGLLLGVVFLRNLRKLDWESYAWWAALVIFILFVCTCLIIIIVQEVSNPLANFCKTPR